MSPSITLSSQEFLRTTHTTAALSRSSVTTPIAPPTSELSGPMMAFCTTLLSSSSTTRSKALSWATVRRPMIRSSTTTIR